MSKRKRKRLTPDQLRQAYKELPVTYENEEQVPKPLASAMRAAIHFFVIESMASSKRKALHREIEKGWDEERRFEDWLGVLDLLWSLVDRKLVDQHCPYSCPWIGPDRRRGGFIIQWRTLCSVKTKGGTFWYGSAANTVTIGGADYVPAFSQHAIDRMRDRAGGGADLFYDVVTVLQERITLDYISRTEPWIVDGDLYGFESWEPITEDYDFIGGVYLDALEIRRQEGIHLLATYHPCEFENQYALAKTSLLPGMRGTPQYNRDIEMPTSVEAFKQMKGFKQILNLQHSKSPIVKKFS